MTKRKVNITLKHYLTLLVNTESCEIDFHLLVNNEDNNSHDPLQNAFQLDLCPNLF